MRSGQKHTASFSILSCRAERYKRCIQKTDTLIPISSAPVLAFSTSSIARCNSEFDACFNSESDIQSAMAAVSRQSVETRYYKDGSQPIFSKQSKVRKRSEGGEQSKVRRQSVGSEQLQSADSQQSADSMQSTAAVSSGSQ